MYFKVQDNSFESEFPAGLGMDQNEANDDPIPLGDEVSMGVISRESEDLAYQYNSQSPMPMPDPNRVQGRRGGRRSVSRSSHNGFPHPTNHQVSAEFNHREVRHERYASPEVNYRSPQHNLPAGYRTHLGNQSMI